MKKSMLILFITTVLCYTPVQVNAKEEAMTETEKNTDKVIFNFKDNRQQEQTIIKDGKKITISLEPVATLNRSLGIETEPLPYGTYTRRVTWTDDLVKMSADYNVTINPYVGIVNSVTAGSFSISIGQYITERYFVSDSVEPSIGDYIVTYSIWGGTHLYTLRGRVYPGGYIEYNVFGTW